MLVHKSATLALPLLLVLLAITPSAEAGCTGSPVTAPITVATGRHEAPPLPLNHNTMQGTTVYIVSAPTAGKFELAPTPGTAVSVIAGKYLPDFDVAWYTAQGDPIDKAAGDGPEVGKSIPSNAATLVIWMAYGPDLGNSDSKLAQAQFTLLTGCS